MKRAVICFTRVPRAGVTKTRLLTLLRPQQCAALHRAFLHDLAAVYAEVDAALLIAHTDEPDWAQLCPLFPTAEEFFPQCGDGLGARMDHAMRHAFSLGFDAVVLTGSDLPLLRPQHLHAAFAALEGADVVLGPTSDGGYYLVGSHRPCSAIFQNRHYGGSGVYEQTVLAARAAGLRVAQAMPCDDVDTPEDLRALRPAQGSYTAQFLDSLRKEGILP